MEEKILQEIINIRKDHSRLKDIVYDDLKELYEENGFLKDRVDAVYDAHRRNTILFLALLTISFACYLRSFLRNR